VTVADIRGDLHLHTDWSPDGRQDLETLVGRARQAGYEYIAVTGHGSQPTSEGSPTRSFSDKESSSRRSRRPTLGY
jgi:histidinol phosphatase-like PHP family hydrolase